jgi:hypothetical protein
VQSQEGGSRGLRQETQFSGRKKRGIFEKGKSTKDMNERKEKGLSFFLLLIWCIANGIYWALCSAISIVIRANLNQNRTAHRFGSTWGEVLLEVRQSDSIYIERYIL